jgi:hypothetical protein
LGINSVKNYVYMLLKKVPDGAAGFERFELVERFELFQAVGP